MNGTELRGFIHFPILTWISYSDLRRNIENWPILKFVFIHCKAVKVSQNDQILIWTWFTSVFLMNGTELRSFSHFQILTIIAYPYLSRNLQIDQFWSLSSFAIKQWKSVKMIKFGCKHDLQVFSWWIEQNSEVFLIFRFWPRLHTWTLAETWKLTNFRVFFIHCKTEKVSQNDQIRR